MEGCGGDIREGGVSNLMLGEGGEFVFSDPKWGSRGFQGFIFHISNWGRQHQLGHESLGQTNWAQEKKGIGH